MKTEESILKVLYENNFIWKRAKKNILHLTQKKVDKLKCNISQQVKDEKLLNYIMNSIENFLFDYSEVEEIEKYECYKTGWRDRENVQKEISSLDTNN